MKLILSIIVLLGFFSTPALAENLSSQIFKSSLPGIFQIAVVNGKTKEKEGIGTGFRIQTQSALPMLVTNYHVIAEYTQEPDKFEIEYRTEDGKSGKLNLVAIDVVHDLAVLVSQDEIFPGNKKLHLGTDVLSKGQRIFSIGNPHDKGMMVVEGAYGGTIKNKFYDHIIFAGASLNPGMSGGPALDEEGRVIGVNVSIAANDINYLVPVSFLKALILSAEKVDPSAKRVSRDWRKMVVEQVLAHQTIGINTMLAKEPAIAELKGFTYPKNLDASFKCWGGGQKRDDYYSYDRTWVYCSQESDIYVNPDVRTGKIRYALAYMEGSKISRQGFDDEYSEYYGSSWLTDEETEDDMNEFECESGFTRHAGDNWKTALCTRTYKGYAGLYDVYFSSAILGHRNKAYYYKVSMEGVDLPLAQSFLKKLTGHISWKE